MSSAHTGQAGARIVCEVCGPLDQRPSIGLAAGLAVVRDRRLLLVPRAVSPGHGLWSLPGGYLREGESPGEAAVRETLEETGITAVTDALIRAFHPVDTGTPHFLLYAGQAVAGTACAGDDASDAGFFAGDEIPPIVFPSTVYAVRHLLNREVSEP